jgi:ribosome biogenesis GTPase
VAVLFGQSGVGKSSLINAMHPALELPVGDVSRKYDRGSHTTSFACMLRPRDGLILIDTPGIREFETADIEPEELRFLFPELARYAPDCAFSACQHIDEPDCAVLAALERGEIHPDRYESYLRIHEDLESLHEEHHGSPYT